MKTINRAITLLFSITFLALSSTHTLAKSPKIIKGENLSISVFRVDEASIKPYLYEGFEAVADEKGEFSLFVGLGAFTDTYGVEPFQLIAMFVEVQEKGKSRASRHFLPIWGANSTKEAVKTYNQTLGLPFTNPKKLSVTVSDSGTQKASFTSKDDAKYGKATLNVEIQKQAGTLQNSFAQLTLVGKVKDSIKFTKDVLGFSFVNGNFVNFDIEANAGSPLSLISKDTHIYTLVSNNHAAILYP